MTATAQSIANQALALSPEDKAFLANAILQSLESQPVAHDREWEEVVSKRMQDVKNGTSAPISQDEFLKRTRR
jgi:putative addiction module component (TIGR02574 family)